MIVQVKCNGRYEKLAFFSANMWLYFGNDTRYDHSVNADEWKLVCDISNSVIFSDLG